MIEIVGAQGNVSTVNHVLEKLQDFCTHHNLTGQVFNAEMIYGRNHLISSVLHAQRAMEQHLNTTNSLAMEILLYASGDRQLKHAIPKMGIQKGQTDLVFVFTDLLSQGKSKFETAIIDDLLQDLKLTRNDAIIEGTEETLRHFGITKKERQTVVKDKYEDLILEKVAMVDIIK
jgi:tRNA threonylcarbamoyladenosine modification (KEOPS) complex Cgi121 subunit